MIKGALVLISRGATTQDTRSSWTERSMTSTFSPVESSTQRVPHLSVRTLPLFPDATLSVLESFRDSTYIRMGQSVFITKQWNYIVLLTFLAGNGVVIHLPGLFEEGDKNEKKGVSKLSTRTPV